MEGPKFSKRRKFAKNKKKSWRGIDITTTEEFLEDERFQLRTTGLVAEKSDDQLFVLEREGEEESVKDTAPSKRRPRAELRCYSVLTNRSRIECPRKEYPTDTNFESKVVHRETRSLLAARRNATPAKAAAEHPTGIMKDIWGEEEEETNIDDFFSEVTKRKRVQPPKHIKRKVSVRPAVEVPHPGASVNPAYDDHQELLLQAHLVEVEKEKAERRVFNALDAKFPSLSKAPTEATWIKEMSGGLFKEEEQSRKDEKEDMDDKHISINPPVTREKKKTPKERRKQKAAKTLKQQMLQKKTEKERENKVYSVAKIRSELAREARAKKRNAQLKAQKMEERKYTPKKLGKTKVATPDLDLKLSGELVGNLRSLKPEGHLLEDRYKSLQLRNIIEPRSKANKKKTKTKKFEKKSFREVTI